MYYILDFLFCLIVHSIILPALSPISKNIKPFRLANVIKAIKLIEDKGYNVSCQYRITDCEENIEDKLHNGNPYDKEILDGVFEHLAIVDNPRYEGAMIAVNAIMDKNAICRNEEKEIEENIEITAVNNTDDVNIPEFIEILKAINDAKFESLHPRDEKGQFSEINENTTHKNILDIETKNRNLKYEVGAIFDKDGNIIKEVTSNNSDEIDLGDENLDYMKGAILTHNHPEGSPISAPDIATGFYKADLAELRATTPQGKVYSLKPNDKFSKENTLKFAQEYSKVHLEAAKSFRDLCKKEIQAGKLDIDFLKSNMDNLFKVYAWKEAEKFLEQNADKYGFDYKKE